MTADPLAKIKSPALLRRIFEIDPLTCPRCPGAMGIMTVVTDPAVIIRILAHRARDYAHRARSAPSQRRSPALNTASHSHR